MYIFIIEQKILFMKLGVIILVAALVISIIFFTIMKPKTQDGAQKAVEPEAFPEPVVEEAPAAPVEVPVEEVIVEEPVKQEVVEPKPAKKPKAKASTETKKVIVKKPK